MWATVMSYLGWGPRTPAEGEEEEYKPRPLNLDDHHGLKRHLDEVVTDIIISRGYDEDFTLSNVKMGIGLLACVVAVVSQLYPKSFPDNQPFLLGCIALYIALNVLLQLVVIFKEKNFFLITHPQLGSFTQTGLAVSSRIERYGDMYTLRIESVDPASASAHAPVELTKSITKWYTSEGLLAEDIFLDDVQRLVEDYEDDSNLLRHKKSK